MDNSYILDLQTKEGIDEGIKYLLGKNYSKFKAFLTTYLFEESEEFDVPFDLNYLTENIDIDWESIDISEIWLKNYHFTTRNSKDETLNSPIYDLRYMVTQDTNLKAFFYKRQIEFDLINHQVIVEGETFDIFDHNDEIHNPLY